MNILKKLILLMSIVIFAHTQTNTKKPTLLFYCGITMVKPMKEIAKIIEEKYDCKIIIMQGASKDLKDSILFSKKGDLYLPGSDSYLTSMIKNDLIENYKYVGYNQAAIFVHKTNPLNIKTLEDIDNEKYNIALGNPGTGSVGKITKKILTNYKDENFYDKIYYDCVEIATDSRTLNDSLMNNIADITINWRATAFWDDNKKYIDIVNIDKKYSPKKKLILSVLKFSKHKKIANAFIDYASSSKGKFIMKQYGFLD